MTIRIGTTKTVGKREEMSMAVKCFLVTTIERYTKETLLQEVVIPRKTRGPVGILTKYLKRAGVSPLRFRIESRNVKRASGYGVRSELNEIDSLPVEVEIGVEIIVALMDVVTIN